MTQKATFRRRLNACKNKRSQRFQSGVLPAVGSPGGPLPQFRTVHLPLPVTQSPASPAGTDVATPQPRTFAQNFGPVIIDGHVIRTPMDLGLQSYLEKQVLALRAAVQPENTSKAMDPKQEEYRQYCDEFYNHHTHRYTASPV